MTALDTWNLAQTTKFFSLGSFFMGVQAIYWFCKRSIRLKITVCFHPLLGILFYVVAVTIQKKPAEYLGFRLGFLTQVSQRML